MTQVPSLTTKRLTLRPPTAADLGVYTAFNTVSDFSYGAYRGGKSDAETKALLTNDITHWACGFGMWLISLADGEVVGGAGLVHPDGWPSPEMTWWLMPDHRRMGYATEASRAVIEFGYGVLGWPQVETYMRDDNFPARQLAERLGGTPVRREMFPDGISRDVFAFPRNQSEGKA